MWEKAQGGRTKGSYRTTDDIEIKHTKHYDLALNNGINFVKQEVLKGMKLKERMKKLEEQVRQKGMQEKIEP